MAKFVYRLFLAIAIVAALASGAVHYQNHEGSEEAQIAGTLVMR